jgi:predicted PurR-regulated permease PerM
MTSIITQIPPEEPEDPSPFWARRLIHISGGLLVLAVLYTLYFARAILIPMAIALLLSALLHPFVQQLRRLRVPEGIGAMIAVAALLGIVGIGFYRLSVPAAEWFARGPSLIWRAEFKLSGIKDVLKEAREYQTRIEEATRLTDDNEQQAVVIKDSRFTQTVLSQTQYVLFTGFVVIVVLYFLLARGRITLERFTSSLSESQGEKWKTVLLRTRQEITRYLGTVALINMGLGLATAITMFFLGMPNPILWGVVGGLLNFAPYIGSLITAAMLALVSLITFDTWGRILLPPLLFYFMTALEGQFLSPMILGKRLSLNPLILLVSLLFWGWVWGIPGMLLAVPIQASLKIISSNMPGMFTLREILR